MTASELKYRVEKAGHCPYFFSRKTMKFFGDTMRNYGVRSDKVNTRNNKDIEVWALYRKKPVIHGLQDTAYFDKQTFDRVFPNE